MNYPNLGFGIGLRPEYYQQILNEKPAIDWFEVISENYFTPQTRARHFLEKIRQDYPIVMHGVSLSIGSTEPLKPEYLKDLKQLAQWLKPAWISDHLCWTGLGKHDLHDLLPLPYTEEALNHVVQRVSQVQAFLGRRILLENVSSYMTYCDSAMTEWEFLREVAVRADCLILLDVNNVYVSATNHGFDAMTYLEAMPVERVQQFHIAGHTQLPDIIIDTHDEPITAAVWDLYAQACELFPDVATLIERDDNYPPLVDLLTELAQARLLHAQAQEVCA